MADLSLVGRVLSTKALTFLSSQKEIVPAYQRIAELYPSIGHVEIPFNILQYFFLTSCRCFIVAPHSLHTLLSPSALSSPFFRYIDNGDDPRLYTNDLLRHCVDLDAVTKGKIEALKVSPFFPFSYYSIASYPNSIRRIQSWGYDEKRCSVIPDLRFKLFLLIPSKRYSYQTFCIDGLFLIMILISLDSRSRVAQGGGAKVSRPYGRP